MIVPPELEFDALIPLEMTPHIHTLVFFKDEHNFVMLSYFLCLSGSFKLPQGVVCAVVCSVDEELFCYCF